MFDEAIEVIRFEPLMLIPISIMFIGAVVGVLAGIYLFFGLFCLMNQDIIERYYHIAKKKKI